ncbi:hypothetical protein UXO62_01455 [Enterobacter cloacae]|uniref:hypothetical protein n=1 Tax=Enterobacter cloacae TaxID=550 RepID=UPI002FCEF107
MSWQGIPFPFNSAEIFYNAKLALYKIPKIIIENADNTILSDTIIAAFIGGALPALVAYLALRHNSKSLKAQLNQQSELASSALKAQIVTANRKDWVNDLRDTTSNYLASFQGVMNASNFVHHERSSAKTDMQKVQFFSDMRTSHLQDMCSQSWKIKLLLKPEHKESASVSSTLDQVVQIINENKFYNTQKYDGEITPIFRKLTADVKAIIDSEMLKFETIS